MVDSRRVVEGTAESLSDLSHLTDRRFDEIRDGLVEQRQYVEFAFGRLEQAMNDRFDAVDARFTRLERTLDQFIDTQTRTNQLVERRLQLLEDRRS